MPNRMNDTYFDFIKYLAVAKVLPPRHMYQPQRVLLVAVLIVKVIEIGLLIECVLFCPLLFFGTWKHNKHPLGSHTECLVAFELMLE